jgi:hypothetical protein
MQQSNTIKITRYATKQTHDKKDLFQGWIKEPIEGLEATIRFEDQEEHTVKSTFSYNDHGEVNGWHPIDIDFEFFTPYRSRIFREGRHLKAGQTRIIKGR